MTALVVVLVVVLAAAPVAVPVVGQVGGPASAFAPIRGNAAAGVRALAYPWLGHAAAVRAPTHCSAHAAACS